MQNRCALFAILIQIGVGTAGTRLCADEAQVVSAAAIHKGRLICLTDGGTIRVWDAQTDTYAMDDSNQLSRKGLIGIAADGDNLWAADKSAAYRWSSKDKAWEKISDVDSGGENLFGIAVVGGNPLLVFPSSVADPVRSRSFKIPKPEGSPLEMLSEPPLRILVIHGTDSRLWIGTGRGEWGGALVGFDPKANKWFYEIQSTLYVTGITHSSPDAVTCSWSMSHFDNNTLVRVHEPDATIKTSYENLRSKYYQALAFSSCDKALYGIESADLVTISNGKPTKIVHLDGKLYEREPNAMGSGPAVKAILPIGPKTVAIVPKRGDPWMMRDGKLSQLSEP
jgi:hypothetical protein